MLHNKKKVIFWDFDGVLIESNEAREFGFKEVLKNYPKDQVNKLLLYHRENGGLSRYVKFKYFFEEILGEKITQEQIKHLADLFSDIMLKILGNKNQLIGETVNFIEENHQKFHFHIVSGSDGIELKTLCKKLEIQMFFKTIEGSPTPKIYLVKNIMTQFQYNPNNCILIGDSINDYEAAVKNGLAFFGFNSSLLKKKFPDNYIETFENFYEQI